MRDSQCTCGSQKTTLWSWFSPPILTEVPGAELRAPGFVRNACYPWTTTLTFTLVTCRSWNSVFASPPTKMLSMCNFCYCGCCFYLKHYELWNLWINKPKSMILGEATCPALRTPNLLTLGGEMCAWGPLSPAPLPTYVTSSEELTVSAFYPSLLRWRGGCPKTQ